MSLGLPGMDMYLPGTFHIHPGIYVGLPCTYYICPWDFLGMDIDLPGTFSAIHPWNAHMSLDSLGWTCTYQVHSI